MKRLFVCCVVLAVIISCAHMNEAEKAFQLQDYETTIRLCLNAIEADSLDFDAMRLLSRTYIQTDSMIQARNTAQRAYDLDRESRQNRRALCNVFDVSGDKALQEGSEEYALTWYMKAAELCSTDTGILRKKADMLSALNSLDRAMNQYKRLRTMKSDTAGVAGSITGLEIRKAEADNAFEKGLDQYSRGRIKTAKKYLSKAADLNRDNDDARYYLYLASGRSELKYRRKTRLWQAIEFFGKASTVKPEKAAPHYFMAKAYEKKDGDEFTNAIDEYKKAAALEPDGPYAKESAAKARALRARKKKLDDFWGRGKK